MLVMLSALLCNLGEETKTKDVATAKNRRKIIFLKDLS